MRRWAESAVCAAVLLLGSGCGDETGPEPQGPKPEHELAIAPAPESGDGQHGLAGRELPRPLRVLVTRDGDPAAGVTVFWTTEGGAITGNGATDADGLATARWTLPRVASSELRARATVRRGAQSDVVFHASASFPSLELLHGNRQRGTVGTTLPEPLQVRVTWQGSPLEGEPIHWSPNVEPRSEHTDADGIATATWRLRTVSGAVWAWARLDGSDPPQISFRATALCTPGEPCVTFPPVAYVWQGAVLASNLDGSEPVVLVDRATRPEWSPDGARIAFSRPTDNNLDKWQLCVARADGSGARCVVGDRDGSIRGRPSWSPDGSKIAFTMWVHSCPNGQCGQHGGFFSSLRVLNVAGMQVDSVDTPPLTSVSWSPDGRKIAFTTFSTGPFGGGSLGLVNPDGSEREILASSLGSYLVSEVAWSPDGRRLALTLVDQNACPWYCDTAIGVVEADATQLRVLATGRTGDGSYVSWPAWSPDGALIAYTLGEGDSAGYDAVYAGSDILVVNAEGGASEVLVLGGGLPSWRQ
jgi:WD40-like Beta Propeller Repeat